MILDVNGLDVEKGDIVAPITGDFKGRVCATKFEDGEGFVSIRASHRPYSKGVWYAAEHVQRLQLSPERRETAPKLIQSPTRTKAAIEATAAAEAAGDKSTQFSKKSPPTKKIVAKVAKTTKKKVTKKTVTKKKVAKKVAKKTASKKTSKRKTTKAK